MHHKNYENEPKDDPWKNWASAAWAFPGWLSCGLW